MLATLDAFAAWYDANQFYGTLAIETTSLLIIAPLTARFVILQQNLRYRKIRNYVSFNIFISYILYLNLVIDIFAEIDRTGDPGHRLIHIKRHLKQAHLQLEIARQAFFNYASIITPNFTYHMIAYSTIATEDLVENKEKARLSELLESSKDDGNVLWSPTRGFHQKPNNRKNYEEKLRNFEKESVDEKIKQSIYHDKIINMTIFRIEDQFIADCMKFLEHETEEAAGEKVLASAWRWFRRYGAVALDAKTLTLFEQLIKQAGMSKTQQAIIVEKLHDIRGRLERQRLG